MYSAFPTTTTAGLRWHALAVALVALAVTAAPADCNGDGLVNFADINPFVALLSAGL